MYKVAGSSTTYKAIEPGTYRGGGGKRGNTPPWTAQEGGLPPPEQMPNDWKKTDTLWKEHKLIVKIII